MRRNHLFPGAAISFLVLLLTACASQHSSTFTLSDLGTRYWKGTYYLSVEGQPFSIQCDVNPSYKVLEDVAVRYKGQNALVLFDGNEGQTKIDDLRQKCLQKSISVFQ